MKNEVASLMKNEECRCRALRDEIVHLIRQSFGLPPSPEGKADQLWANRVRPYKAA